MMWTVYEMLTKRGCLWTLKRRTEIRIRKVKSPNRIPIHVILRCPKMAIFARSVDDISHHEHFIVKFAENALLGETIIVFGWTAVSVNQITNSF